MGCRYHEHEHKGCPIACSARGLFEDELHFDVLCDHLGGQGVLPRFFLGSKQEEGADIARGLLWCARCWIVDPLNGPVSVLKEQEQEIENLERYFVVNWPCVRLNYGHFEYEQDDRGVVPFTPLEPPTESAKCLYHEKRGDECPPNCCLIDIFSPRCNASDFNCIYQMYGGEEVIPDFFDFVVDADDIRKMAAQALVKEAMYWKRFRLGGPWAMMGELKRRHAFLKDLDDTLEDLKVMAFKEKEAGNAAYKKNDFETALEHCSKAIKLDDEDVSFVANQAAVNFETGKAVERGKELCSDNQKVAISLKRKGSALVKMAKSSKLNETHKAKKDMEQQGHFETTIVDEEREKGNQYFKEQNYPEAIKHYTKSIKKNPNNPKAYSNRAGCYTILGALPEHLKDAEKCIELDPTFSRGYTRKGTVQFFMKEYEEALETYQKGLKLVPHSQELLVGVTRCVDEINKASCRDVTLEELKEREGMQDPEVPNIL